MKTEYLPTFIKDLKALKSTPVYTTIKNLAFQDILVCQNLSNISNIKKLKGEDNAYRIRVGDYRIGPTKLTLSNDFRPNYSVN